MKMLALHTCASQPGGDGRFGKTKDTDGGGNRQTFGQGG